VPTAPPTGRAQCVREAGADVTLIGASPTRTDNPPLDNGRVLARSDRPLAVGRAGAGKGADQ